MSAPLHAAIAVLCGTTGGPATYGRRLVAALGARDDLRLSVLTDRPELFADARCDVVHLPLRSGLDRLRWTWAAVPRALRRLRPDVFHDTKNALPWRCPVPAVVTVHDLAYYRCPESFSWASRLFLRRATSGAVARAARVLVPSEATAADVAAIYPRAAGRTRVVLHGIDPHRPSSAAARDAVRRRLDLPAHFVLHVGTVQARKNVDLLVRAVRQLRGEGLPHRLVVAGRRGWLADAAFAEFARDDTAQYLGEVSDEDLRALYDLADAFASPSGYEGFGFTVADALAAGTPCVISDVSSLPEVCGAAAERIGALEPDAIAGALRAVLGDPARAAELRRLGPARAAEFSWARCAAATAAVYREAAAAT